MGNNKVWGFVKDKYIYVTTFVLACLMILGAWIIGDVGPFGGKSMVVVDGVHQYLPFFSEYQHKLMTLGSMQYTFDVGLGNNFLSLWSYYLSSPFNLIIILFSKKHLPMALNLIISAKIILGAVSFAYFLMHVGSKPKKHPGIIAFSLFYAFSSYVVGYSWNLMWLDCIFAFPIVILGMEKMFAKKDSRMYILALLYCFICNYYISFMICMFLVLWFFTLHFTGVKDFFVKGIRFAIASLTAAALSAVVLIPAYKGIMTTASAEFELPEWEFYGSFADTLRSHLFCSDVMTNQIGDAGTNLYCGIFTIFLAMMFFFEKDIRLEKKIKYLLLLALMIVSFNNQTLNYIWHGFHNQYGIPNRFAFLYIFVLLIMAYEAWLKRETLHPLMAVAAYTVSMMVVVFCYYHAETTYDTKIYAVNAGLLTVYFLLLVAKTVLPGGGKVFAGLLTALAIFEMAVNGCNAFRQVGSSDVEYYYGDTETFDTLKDRVEGADDGFYRSDILEPVPVDEATWYNLRSVGIFGSTVRGELVDVMGELGFYTGANEYLYYGATPFTNALLGVKYVYTRDGDFVNVYMDHCDTEDPISVYQNRYSLPLGYMVGDEILDYDSEGNGPFTVANDLSNLMTGVDPIFESVYEDLHTEVYGTNVDVTLRDEFNADYTNANDSARGDIIYTIPYDMDLYVSCRGSNVNKIALLIDGNEVAYDRYQGQLFRVGNVKAGQTVDIQFALKDGEAQQGELYCYPMTFNEERFLKFYNMMASRSMDVTTFSDTKIEGTVHADEDCMLMTSIPYDDGWHVYIDGEEDDSWIVLDGFLGVSLEKGDHTITMKYRCPGLLNGLLFTLVGCILFFIICQLEKTWREGNRVFVKPKRRIV